MVKKPFFIALSAFFLNFTYAVFLFAGEFTASVSSAQVNLNESFSLNLALKNSTPKGTPSINDLKKNFVINSQQQSSNTTIVNGKVTSSIIWKLSLVPKIEGAVQIPAITIETSEGPLSTQPITLNVTKGSTRNPKEEGNGVEVITKVNNAAPYKNEPIIYTAILTSKLPLYNVQAQKMQLNDSIIEFLGEPKLEERNIGGVIHYVVEFSYLITPLKSGTLTIPPISIQGAIAQKKKRHFSSVFDDDLDPFDLMQGFDRLKSFALTAEEIQLDVQPPIPEVSPWLPAKALTLEEQWSNDQTLRVGEPFSRSFVIKAEGIKLSQLPHLEDLQKESSKFKVYADKPEEQENILEGKIQSMRKEQYTFIPNQAGALVLPEISISWWDTVKKEKRNALIPARTVTILPSVEAANAVSVELPVGNIGTTENQNSGIGVQSPVLLYSLIGILTFLLFAAMIWIYTLQRKIASLTTEGPKRIKPTLAPQPVKPAQKSPEVKKEKKEKLPDLNPT